MPAIVTFDFPNRRIIEISASGDNALDVDEIYSEWKIAVQAGNFLGEQPAFSTDDAGNDGTVGGFPTPTPTGKLGTTFFLGAGWKIRPSEENHRLILRGNIYSADGSRVTADTLGAYTVEVAIQFTNLIDDLDTLNDAVINQILPEIKRKQSPRPMQVLPIRNNVSVSVTGATNALPIVITTETDHQMVDGELVDVQSVQGNLNANVTAQAVSSVTATTFTLADIKGSGLYVPLTGVVSTRDAFARDYAAATAAEGTVHLMFNAALTDRFNFLVDAASDPTTTNKEVDITVYGRLSDDSDWVVIQQIDETTAGWAQVGSGRWTNQVIDLAMYPQLRMDVAASSGSTNTCKGWIAV